MLLDIARMHTRQQIPYLNRGETNRDLAQGTVAHLPNRWRIAAAPHLVILVGVGITPLRCALVEEHIPLPRILIGIDDGRLAFQGRLCLAFLRRLGARALSADRRMMPT